MPLFSLPAGNQSAFQVGFSHLLWIWEHSPYVGSLRFNCDSMARAPIYAHAMRQAICIWAAAKSAAFLFGAVNRGYWRYTSLDEAVRIGLANSVGSVVGGVIIVLLGHPGLPRSIYILEWLISCSLTLGARFAVRLAMTAKRGSQKRYSDRTKTLIYGAGAAGLALARELRENQALNYWVVGLIDDDSAQSGLDIPWKESVGHWRDSRSSGEKVRNRETADCCAFSDWPATRAHIAVRH